MDKNFDLDQGTDVKLRSIDNYGSQGPAAPGGLPDSHRERATVVTGWSTR